MIEDHHIEQSANHNHVNKNTNSHSNEHVNNHLQHHPNHIASKQLLDATYLANKGTIKSSGIYYPNVGATVVTTNVPTQISVSSGRVAKTTPSVSSVSSSQSYNLINIAPKFNEVKQGLRSFKNQTTPEERREMDWLDIRIKLIFRSDEDCYQWCPLRLGGQGTKEHYHCVECSQVIIESSKLKQHLYSEHSFFLNETKTNDATTPLNVTDSSAEDNSLSSSLTLNPLTFTKMVDQSRALNDLDNGGAMDLSTKKEAKEEVDDTKLSDSVPASVNDINAVIDKVQFDITRGIQPLAQFSQQTRTDVAPFQQLTQACNDNKYTKLLK